MNWQDYQSIQHAVQIQDRFISYVDRADATEVDQEPVVLLHGIPTWGYLWKDLIGPLSQTRRTLVPDLLGFGFSDQRDCFDRSIARQAEYVDAWMDRLGLESAMFIAHDIGGGVALRLATLFPNRVSRLCLLNTICYDSWPIELMLQFGHPWANRKMSASTAMKMLGTALRSGFSHAPDGELLDGLLAPYRTEVGKQSLVRNAAALNTNQTTEITHLLPRISVSTLVLWGEDDTFQDIKFGRRLADDIPGAEFVAIADARHFVMIDQPELVATHVCDFAAKAKLVGAQMNNAAE